VLHSTQIGRMGLVLGEIPAGQGHTSHEGVRMRDRFFVIWGGKSQNRNSKAVKPPLALNSEPDTEILKRSPCLYCELFVNGTICPYVQECSKIDAYQRVAAVHCTLCKSQDVRSMT
jgi:hypothetical protein